LGRRRWLRDFLNGRLHLLAVAFVARERREQFVGLPKSGFRGARFQLERRLSQARKLALDHDASLRHRLLVLLRLEPLANLRARTVAPDVAEVGIQPVARRTALLGGDDLDLLTIAQRMVERNHLAVDARPATAVTEARVNGVREVDRRRAAR